MPATYVAADTRSRHSADVGVHPAADLLEHPVRTGSADIVTSCTAPSTRTSVTWSASLWAHFRISSTSRTMSVLEHDSSYSLGCPLAARGQHQHRCGDVETPVRPRVPPAYGAQPAGVHRPGLERLPRQVEVPLAVVRRGAGCGRRSRTRRGGSSRYGRRAPIWSIALVPAVRSSRLPCRSSQGELSTSAATSGAGRAPTAG